MSNAILTRAYQSTVTSPTDMAVLASLADQANDDGICWPSVGSLSRRTRLGERTVQMSLRRLAADRHISTTGHVAGGAPRQTPTYVVHPILPAAHTGAGDAPVQHVHPSTGAPHAPVQEMHPSTGAGDAPHGCTSCTPRVQEMHPRGAGAAPEPSVNHKEPSENPHASTCADASARTRAREGTSVLLDVDPNPKKGKGGAMALAVEWDGAAFRVPPALLAEWRGAFPAVDVPGAIRAAAAWVTDNPSRAGKKQWARFLLNWLKRTRPGESPPPSDDADPLPPPLPTGGPAGWERAYEALYDHEPTRAWAQQIDAVQEECLEWLKTRRAA